MQKGAEDLGAKSWSCKKFFCGQ